jgi:phosphoribosylamine---glycine ligase
MRVLILGSGGREHAIGLKISGSSLLDATFFGPGNAGTEELGTNVPLDPTDFPAVVECVKANRIDMVVVGPEAPLVAGIADHFAADKSLASVAVIGPQKAGAALEGSKVFSKEFMHRHRIPTAKYGTFGKGEVRDALAFLRKMKAPYVVKASGLAAGKGVIVTEVLSEAEAAVRSMIRGESFGSAGREIVIEEFLKGVEVSMFIVTDGNAWRLLSPAMDYKRIGEDNTGPNTGGMGAISPVPHVTPEFMEKVKNQVVIPTIRGLQRDGIPYQGFLFFGLMKVQGDPYVIEYNCRLGDPETQIVLPLLETDLLHLMDGLANGLLSEIDVSLSPKAAAAVILASEGYPGEYKKGEPIRFPDAKTIGKDQHLVHAGTARVDGEVVTAGGRVMACVGTGADVKQAAEKAHALAQAVEFNGKTFRSDIGTVA